MISTLTTIDGLFSSNCAPGPLEIGMIQEVVDQLKKQVSGLRAQLAECEDQLRRHQGLLSAIRRVPAEVLGVIFGFVVPAECLDEDGRAQVVNLSLVCRLWCDATRSVHRFWNFFQVRDIDLDYEKAVAWFSRSDSTRRTLRIQREVDGRCNLHYGNGTKSECRLASPALVRLLVEGPTLDQLCIEVNGLRCLQHLLDLLVPHGNGCAPWDRVKSLTFDICMPRSDISTSSIPLNGVPSCINALRLEYPYGSMPFDRRQPFWIQSSAFERLTFLSVESWWTGRDGAVLLEALACCLNLEVLALDFVHGIWSCSENSIVVELPKLRTLNLSQPKRDLKLLNFIYTPALVLLGLFINPSVPEPDGLRTFIQRISALQDDLRVSLHFGGIYTPDEVVDFLQHIPKVSHLILEGVVTEPKDRGVEDDLFDRFRQEPLMGGLEVLEILNLPAEFDFSSIKRYIKSRQRDDELKSLIVKYDTASLPEGCTIDTAAYVQELRETGVSVDITFPEIDRDHLLSIYNL